MYEHASRRVRMQVSRSLCDRAQYRESEPREKAIRPRRREKAPDKKRYDDQQHHVPLAARVASGYIRLRAVCPAQGIGLPKPTGAARATRLPWGRGFSWSGVSRAPSGAPFPVGGKTNRGTSGHQHWSVGGRNFYRSSTMYAFSRESDRQKLERMRRAYGPRRRATCWTRQRCGRVTGQCPWQAEGGRA